MVDDEPPCVSSGFCYSTICVYPQEKQRKGLLGSDTSSDRFPTGGANRARHHLLRIAGVNPQSVLARIWTGTPLVLRMKADLEERLQEFEANAEACYSWEQVEAHLLNGPWRSS